MRRFGIRPQVLIALSLTLIIIFAVITGLLVAQNTNRLRQSLIEQSKSFAELATKPIGDTFVLYRDSGRVRIVQQIDRFSDLNPDVTNVRVVDVSGNELFSRENSENKPIDANLAASFEPQSIFDSPGNLTAIAQPYIEDTGAHRYSIIYDISSDRSQQDIKDVVRLIIYIAIGALLFSIAATAFLLNRLFLRPITELSRAANKISEGDLNQQIDSKRPDEIGELTRSVNAMAQSLKRDIVKLKEVDRLKSEFMMITSHNLRTPITVMEGYIEMLPAIKDEGELKNIKDALSASVLRLKIFAEDIMTISTIESGKVQMKREPADVKHLLDSLSKEFSLLASKKKLNWKFKNALPDKTIANISTSHVKSAIGNLLDNAIKFTPEGGSVSISAKAAGGQISIRVADTGIGIPNSEMPKLFTKFHRVGGTLQYDYEGVGIGLYSTKLIVSQHGGTVDVESTKGKGSVFSISLPV